MVDFELLQGGNGDEFFGQALNLILGEVDRDEFLAEEVQANELEVHAGHLELRLLRIGVELILF